MPFCLPCQQLRHEQTALLEKHRNEYEQKLSDLQTQLNASQQAASTATNSATMLQAALSKIEQAHQEATALNQENKTARDQLKAQYALINTQHQELKRERTKGADEH